MITFYRGNINYNWLSNIIVERNAQVRTFVLSVLRERNRSRDQCLGPGERTGLVVRASDSESGDPGSILGRVGVLFP